MDPELGLYAKVFVVEYSSMYPMVMINCKISPDSIDIRGHDHGLSEGSIHWGLRGVSVVVAEQICMFDLNADSLVPKLLSCLVSYREDHCHTMPTFSTSIKVATNSTFGALGFLTSPIYSPHTSAMVTSIGRWCLILTFGILEARGFDVVYGDIDSCFVVPT